MGNKVASEFDEIYVRRNFLAHGEIYLRKWVDELVVVDEARRVHEKNVGPPFLYLVNHQSCLDYFIPCYTILKSSLPYPRSVIGKNLDNLFVRNLMWDFKKWGGILVNREKTEDKRFSEEKRKYVRALEEIFKKSESVLEFPEAGRNRSSGWGLKNFEEAFFRIVIRIQDKMFSLADKKNIYVVCMALRYDKIPERDYWERIDRNGFGSKSYYFWDLWAYTRWRYFEKQKGRAIVNFDEPVSVGELAGCGSIRERSKRFSFCVQERIEGLLNEVEKFK